MLSSINDYIRQQAYVRSGFIMVDYEAALTDPVTGEYLAGYTTDNTHPSEKGGFQGGRALANAIKPYLAVLSPLQAGISAPGKNLLGVGGRFHGGAGDITTGWKYQGFSVSPGLIQVQRGPTSDITGFWNQYAVPNGDAVDILINIPIDGVTFSIADKVEFIAEYQVDNLDQAPAALTTGFTALIQAYNGASMTSTAYDLQWTAGGANHPVVSRNGTFRTPPLTIPAGTTLAQCLINCHGGGNYRFDRATVRKVT